VSHTFEQFLKRKPVIGENVFLAKGSVVCGAVTLKDHASVWFNAVLRADMNEMTIGCHTNIQDNAVFHVSLMPLELAIMCASATAPSSNGCKVGDNC
jgi:carbonic anhydrase/acetyltransferase-like protein (isoleucine patch superfamily)